MSTDHESIVKACLEDPALRETLRNALDVDGASPDRLKQLGQRLGKLHTRFSSITGRFSQRLNEAKERVRDGYHDTTSNDGR